MSTALTHPTLDGAPGPILDIDRTIRGLFGNSVLTIETQDELDASADTLKQIKSCLAELDRTHKAALAPIEAARRAAESSLASAKEQKRVLNEQVDVPRSFLQAAERTLKAGILAFHQAQEQARMAIQAERDAERQACALEGAKTLELGMVDGDQDLVETGQDLLAHAQTLSVPVSTVAPMSGVHIVRTWKARAVDFALVPERFWERQITPDGAATIQAAAQAALDFGTQGHSIPGVTFSVKAVVTDLALVPERYWERVITSAGQRAMDADAKLVQVAGPSPTIPGVEYYLDENVAARKA